MNTKTLAPASIACALSLGCSSTTEVRAEAAPIVFDSATVLSCGFAQLADFNGDGRPDMLATCGAGSAGSGASIYYNRGRGNFSDPLDVGLPGVVSAFDFDSDGKADAFTTSSGSEIRYGRADSTLSGAVSTNIPSAFDFVDVNDDGYPDALGWDGETFTAYSLDARGRGTVIFTLDAPSRPAVFDFDGDGKVDVVFAQGSSLLFRKGEHVGNFDQARVAITADAPVNDWTQVDIDGDGRADYAAVLTDGEHVSGTALFHANKDGSFSPMRVLPSTKGVGMDLTDATGDGRMDIVLSDQAYLAIMPGNGDGTFGDATILTGPWSDAGSHLFSDLDGDGKPDLIVSDGSITIELRK